MRISDWSSDVCSSDLKDHPVKSQGGQGSGRKRALRHVTRVRKGNATPCKIKIGRLADLFKASRSDFWQHSGKHVVTVEKLVFQSACDVERSEERRVGKEGVSTCRSRGRAYHKKKKKIK